jgi:hypothetical protein
MYWRKLTRRQSPSTQGIDAMQKIVSLFSAAALVCGVSLSSVAQERDQPREGERDRPRDGERERPREGERDRSREGDRGPDGRGPGGFMRMMPVMAALDADADGLISADEIANAAAALKSLDKNADGKLTEEELRPNFPGGPGAAPGGRGAPGAGRGAPEGGFGPPSPEAFADRMLQGDEDKDGKLSRDELAKMAGQFGRGGAGGFGGGRGRPDGEAGRGRPDGEGGRRPEGEREGGRPERPE